MPFTTMDDVLVATASGVVDVGFVAIENSIEGGVNVTSDTLAFEVDVLIQHRGGHRGAAASHGVAGGVGG